MGDQRNKSFLQEELDERKEKQQFRSLTSVVPRESSALIEKEGREIINFCSNDYLGLSKHPELIARSKQYADKYGVGSTASRLISGTYQIHSDLETKIAKAFNREAALLFNSGFQANSSIISTITDRHSLVLADKLSHSSLLQGALLSRATLQRFHHNDLDNLKYLLDKGLDNSFNRIIIVSETVFSMEGDRLDTGKIASLAKQYDALLFIDDAHAVGVWGNEGWGLARDTTETDILLGTCGKALGSFGAFVACTSRMKDYLVNYCPGFIYTTSLPPAVIGAISAAFDIIPGLDKERKKLHENIVYMRDQIQQMGFETGNSSTQIIPIVIGSEKKTLELSRWLEKNGIMATAIRPPTVPEGSSRIRITLSAVHKKKHLDHFLDILGGWKNEEG